VQRLRGRRKEGAGQARRWGGNPSSRAAALPRSLTCRCPDAGVESYDVSLEEQKVVVKGSVAAQTVLEKISKTGKKTELLQ
jgi:hypothetical protein